MSNYHFDGHNPKFEPCPKPDNVIAKISAGESATMDEAGWFLDWVVYRTMVQLKKMRVHPEYHIDMPYSGGMFPGKCGNAQCIISYGLDDLGIKHSLLAIQNLGDGILPHRPYQLCHVNVSVPINVEGSDRWFLIDPTFRQFFYADMPCGKSYHDNSPGNILAESSNGADILDKLLPDGWLQLTPRLAQMYLESFNLGKKAFNRPGDAMAIFSNPPPDEPGGIKNNLWLTRESAARTGWVLEPK